MLYIGKVAYKYVGTMPESTSIVIKDGTTTIAPKAFYVYGGCAGLTAVSIPESVTSIGSSAFYGCHHLSSVTIPRNVTSIGGDAFFNCGSIASVSVNCPVVGSGWFNGLKGLKEITFGDEVTCIEATAFEDCTGLTSLSIPNNITTIGKNAFAGCTQLASLSIGEGVTDMDVTAFSGCTALSSVSLNCPTVSTWFTQMASITGVVMSDNVATIASKAFQKCTGLKSVTISPSVNTIGEYTFDGCSKLASVDIPDGVSTIGAYAFNNNTALKTVSLGSGVASIGQNAFYNCQLLASVRMSNGVTSLGNSAFAYCFKLASISIPSSLVNFGSKAFFYCSALADVYFLNASACPTIGSDVFQNCSSSLKYHVPQGTASSVYSSLDSADEIWPDISVTAKEDPANAGTYYATFYSLPAKYALPAGVEAYVGKVADGPTLNLSKVATAGQVLPAGTPVVLKGSSPSVTMAYSTEAAVTIGDGNSLHGCDLNTATPTDGTVYVLGSNGTETGFYKYGASSLGANKAYLELDGSGGAMAPALRILFGEGTTAIGGVEHTPAVPASIHSLNGQRLAAPRKGVNIINTKKVFVK